MNEYIDYLGMEGKCPGFASEVNGGAQFTRLLYEIEVYFRFCDIQPFMTSTIIGATKMTQLKTCIDSVNLDLTKEILKEIDAVHRELPHPAP